MKQGSTLLLKLVLCFLAAAVLGGLVWLPLTEGRAANLDLIAVYSDPLIVYTFLASIPFFFGVYQAFTLLTLIDRNEAFTLAAVNTLKNMKFASLSIIGFIGLALLYLRFFLQSEDVAGPTMLGIVLSLAFGVIATAAGVFQQLFQNAVDMKMENDLTV